jgi:hypothetical protein
MGPAVGLYRGVIKIVGKILRPRVDDLGTRLNNLPEFPYKERT